MGKGDSAMGEAAGAGGKARLPIEVLAARRPVLFAQFDAVGAFPRLGGGRIVMREVCVACYDLRLLMDAFPGEGVGGEPNDMHGAPSRAALEAAAMASGFHVSSWDWAPSPGGVWGLMARLERESRAEQGGAGKAEFNQAGEQGPCWSARVREATRAWGEPLAGPEAVEEWGMGGSMGRPVLPWLRMVQRHGWADRVAAGIERLELGDLGLSESVQENGLEAGAEGDQGDGRGGRARL